MKRRVLLSGAVAGLAGLAGMSALGFTMPEASLRVIAAAGSRRLSRTESKTCSGRGDRAEVPDISDRRAGDWEVRYLIRLF